MRGRLGTVALVLFIAVCALVTAARIYVRSHPASYAPGPLVPVISTAPALSPEQTITTWVTVTAAP